MTISILDAIIVIFLILGVMSGFRRGFIKQTILLVGLVAVLVISFNLRIPVSTFLYKNLPFFNFNGIFKGVTILNILLYELIAFFVVFSVLYLIFRIILKISGLIESLLRLTIIFGFFSKILGGIVGFIESYVIVFIILFAFSQPFMKVSGIDESILANKILDNTPVMSNAVKDTRVVINEIYNLSETYKDDSKNFNKEAIELFLKYDIITEENLNLLREKGKIE